MNILQNLEPKAVFKYFEERKAKETEYAKEMWKYVDEEISSSWWVRYEKGLWISIVDLFMIC